MVVGVCGYLELCGATGDGHASSTRDVKLKWCTWCVEEFEPRLSPWGGVRVTVPIFTGSGVNTTLVMARLFAPQLVKGCAEAVTARAAATRDRVLPNMVKTARRGG